MLIRIALAVVGAIALQSGCSKEKKPSESEVEAEKAGVKNQELAEIVALLDLAKTPEQFLELRTKCGGVELSAAADGKKLDDDLDFQATCVVGPAKKRAQLAIAESAPGGKMSTHCLTATMDLEGLIEKNIDRDKHTKMLTDVKKACEM